MNIFYKMFLFCTNTEKLGQLLAYEEDRPEMLKSIKKLEDAYYAQPFIRQIEIEEYIDRLNKEWNV